MSNAMNLVNVGFVASSIFPPSPECQCPLLPLSSPQRTACSLLDSSAHANGYHPPASASLRKAGVLGRQQATGKGLGVGGTIFSHCEIGNADKCSSFLAHSQDNSEMCFTPSPRGLHWDWASVARTGNQLMDTPSIGGPPFPLSLSLSFMVLPGIASQINNLHLGSSSLLSVALMCLPSAQLLAASICIVLWVWCFSLAVGIKHSRRSNAPVHPPATVQDAWMEWCVDTPPPSLR